MTRGVPTGTPPKQAAKGFVNGLHRRIVVSLDEDVFYEVQRLAEKNKTSFAEQTRTLLEWALWDNERQEA